MIQADLLQFEDMNAFLERITILKSRLPSDPAYRNCLMDVFTSFLAMCAFATKYIELGRFSKCSYTQAINAPENELTQPRKVDYRRGKARCGNWRARRGS